jgi:hypothetical protein
LAGEDDPDFAELDGPPAVVPLDVEALAQLRRWWAWYSVYKGFDPE